MELCIILQSISDIITNSSSEIFTIKNVENVSELKKLIEEIGESNWFKGSWEEWDKLSWEEQSKYDTGSGMGGELKIQTWEELYNMYKEHVPENKRYLYTPEIWSLNFDEPLEELKNQIWIDIDHSRIATIKWIFENLFVGAADCLCQVDPKTGRHLRVVDTEEWNNLPENERNDY